ncbi:hypothetical protein E2K69_24820, partial [Escherichia coli]
VYCSSEQKLSFYLSGATTDSARQVFANTAPDATKASGVGVSLGGYSWLSIDQWLRCWRRLRHERGERTHPHSHCTNPE